MSLTCCRQYELQYVPYVLQSMDLSTSNTCCNGYEPQRPLRATEITDLRSTLSATENQPQYVPYVLQTVNSSVSTLRAAMGTDFSTSLACYTEYGMSRRPLRATECTNLRKYLTCFSGRDLSMLCATECTDLRTYLTCFSGRDLSTSLTYYRARSLRAAMCTDFSTSLACYTEYGTSIRPLRAPESRNLSVRTLLTRDVSAPR
jgi:hypothetical protein